MNRDPYSTPNHVALIPLEPPIVRYVLWGLAVVIIGVIALPAPYIFAWAFRGTGVVGIFSASSSWSWFSEMLASPEWRSSIVYSALLASGVSLVGATALLLYFYSIRYVHPVIERFTYAIIITPIILPVAVYALSLRILGSALSIPEALLVATGHLVLVIPLQFFICEAAQESVPDTMIHAGTTLGASHLTNLRTIYFPPLRGAFGLAFLAGWFFSFDELVIAAFVIDTPLVTVPKRLWDAVNRSNDPYPAVLAVLLILTFACAVCLGLFGLFLNRRINSNSGRV